MKFIIEHMEQEVYEWCLLEYKHISKIVGKDNLIITNVKKDKNKLRELGTVYEQSVVDILDKFPNTCLLDMDAQQILSTKDKNEFQYFLFGGILGDNPRKHRTQELKKKVKTQTRNLGNKQMSTDTAVYVTKKILSGTKLVELRFADEVEIILNEDKESAESVILPFRYVLDENRKEKVVLPDGLIDYLKKKKTI